MVTSRIGIASARMHSVATIVWRRWACPLALVTTIVAHPLLACATQQPDRCTQVISYFRYPYQNSSLHEFQWRIFDPALRVDTLFASSPQGFAGVRWDTKFRRVSFLSGDSLYVMDWKWGASPRLVGPVPGGSATAWWFDGDGSRCDLLRTTVTEEADHPYYNSYAGELWRKDASVPSWQRVRAEAIGCEDEDCEHWRWANGQLTGDSLAVSLHDLNAEARFPWGGSMTQLDTAAVRLVKGDDASPGLQFVPTQRFPRRGVACSWNDDTVSGPYFFVDLDRQTKTLLPDPLGTSENSSLTLFAERCGLLLMPFGGNPLVLDAGSGNLVNSPTWNTEGAAWILAPRPSAAAGH